ncbi:MAG TPA: endonuclease III [Candidatus Limnocylindria bacterium]|nr:endonuclease III [Candidatus Limnocylindria bacterium]
MPAKRKAKPYQPKVTPELRVRARKILGRLEKAYPDWGPTLEFADPLQLLVATILAAQARDERINEVTRTVVFPKYRTAADYVAVEVRVLERDLKPTGFFRQKTKAVKAAALGIVERFGGEVPRDMEGLTSLHGVGRKTASIVLANAFGVPAIAVDRHVARVAVRLGLTRQGHPDKIEQDLRAVFQENDWVKATWNLILHGRRICNPTPKCPVCPVIDLCPYPRKTKAPSSASRATLRTPRGRAAVRH